MPQATCFRPWISPAGLDLQPGMDTFQVYRALRIVNPSPYMDFLRFTSGPPESSKGAAKKLNHSGTIELAGSSPELLVRVHNGKVEYRPIAGTAAARR